MRLHHKTPKNNHASYRPKINGNPNWTWSCQQHRITSCNLILGFFPKLLTALITFSKESEASLSLSRLSTLNTKTHFKLSQNIYLKT